jgi:hypothetical protein
MRTRLSGGVTGERWRQTTCVNFEPTETIGGMSSDAILQLLLQMLVGAIALFVLRLFWVREHLRFPLYALSMGLSVVFAVPLILPHMGEMSQAAVQMVSFAMDLLLTPFVAMELFRLDPNEEQSPARYLAPAAGALLAGGSIVIYLSTSPDLELFKDTLSSLLLLDTLMAMVVIGYLARKFREGTPPGDSNTMWLRRFFFLMTAMDLAATLLGGFVEKPAASKLVSIVYLSAALVATVACLGLLRKPKAESAPAA